MFYFIFPYDWGGEGPKKKIKKLCHLLGFNAANLVSTSAGPSLSEHLIRLAGHKR